MSNFALQEIPELKGKQRFFKLLNNNKCEFDDFCKMCEGNLLLRKQLGTLIARMKFVADLKYDHLDPTKFKELSGRKTSDIHKDYEVKSKDLRIYFFKDESSGQIIVLGGKKGSQDSDIKRMREIKQQYFK